MIRPERDPHWCLGVEHGRDGLSPYTFEDAENQRRYVEGYGYGRIQREALFAAHPWQRQGISTVSDLQALRPGGVWKARP